MLQYARIKAWFLIKNNKYSSSNNDLRNGYKFNEFTLFHIVKETEKAVLVDKIGFNTWVPKSAIICIEQEGTNEEIIELQVKKETLMIELLKAKESKDIDAIIDIGTDIQHIEQKIDFYNKFK